MYCSREYQTSTRLIQQYEKSTLKERTVMEVSDIILLLEFCLKNAYFSFQDQFYEQVEGAAMGSLMVTPLLE